MNNNKQTHKDIITHYFNNEADHIPLLIAFLKKGKASTEKLLYSNLFNFKVDFDKNEITIEDECRLFTASNPTSTQKITIDKLLSLCNKRLNKK